MPTEKIHFVTGKLAASALENVLRETAAECAFEYSVQVMPITVAALMTPQWIADRIAVPAGTTRIVLPGYCGSDLEPIQQKTGLPVQTGPKDLRRLPGFFGAEESSPDLSHYKIEIIAEINHAARYSLDDVLTIAAQWKSQGADIIDIGCEPDPGTGSEWKQVGNYVSALKQEGFRVSVDSLNPVEIEAAARAGAELVLSVNQSNRHAAPDWGCEVVVIPDETSDVRSLEPTMEFLDKNKVPFRIDPILEPIGFGFAASLKRYMTARELWPDIGIMMGTGNLTELTEVDSAGVNMLLLSICAELKIHSVLTTEVINWARTSVREIDIARRLAGYAIENGVPPKHLTGDLVSLRDQRLIEYSVEQLEELSRLIRDNNYRLFVADGKLHLMGSGLHLQNRDPFEIFDDLMATEPANLDPSHAFYLGYELCKAMTALNLGKQYTQDEALDWGYLTVSEKNRHRLKKKYRGKSKRKPEPDSPGS